MRFSYDQAKSLGIERYWPDKATKIALPETAPPLSKAVDDGMNKLERAFWGHLQEALKRNEFVAAMREPMTLKLAGRTTYKPDFMTFAIFNNAMCFWEVKGFMRDDAAVKLKVAAASFPYFRWVLVQRDRRRWRCIEVTSKGFSRDEWCPEWLS